MICSSTSGLINAIKSRCLLIRIPSPTDNQMSEVLDIIGQMENLSDNSIINEIV